MHSETTNLRLVRADDRNYLSNSGTGNYMTAKDRNICV